MEPVSIIIIVLVIIGMVLMWKGDYPIVGVLILTNIAIFFVQWMQYNFVESDAYFEEVGFRAETLVDGERPWTIFTNLFVHGGFLHVMGNMLFLALLGMPFEDRIGGKKLAIIYFSSGLAANLLDGIVTLMMHGSGSIEAQTIGIGASGAIFGILGAFAILYPRDEIPMILGPIFLQRVPVYIAAMSYALFEIVAVQINPADHIGHVAHVIGFISGVFLGPTIAKTEARKVSKLDYSLLKDLLKSPANSDLENTINNLISAEIREVREAWWENLLKKAKCPVCGVGSAVGGLGEGKHGLMCEKCGYVLDLRKRK